jgi:bacteriophage exclusion system BrxA-like protein
MNRETYTTQLQAGLGLLPETQKLLSIWAPGMTAQELLASVLASGEFPTVSARRLRNIVIEGFKPRYLIEEGAPASFLKQTVDSLSRDDFRSLCFLFTCRANPILADFVREVYWNRYAAGGSELTKQDTVDFVTSAVSDGRTTTKWSDSTITRVSRYLFGACADFGLLDYAKASTRSIVTFRLAPRIASFLAHELHFKGYGDNKILGNPDWGLFGLEEDDVLNELKRLSLHGELIVQSAGGVVQISWKYKSMGEFIDEFVKG